MINAFPALADELEAARKELEDARATFEEESNRIVSIIRLLDPEHLCDFFDDMGAEEYLQQWLAARDARLKAEGAAEWLEKAAKNAREFTVTLTAELLEEEATRLREEI